MKRRLAVLAVVVLAIFVAVFVTGRTRRVSAQGCAPPTYASVFTWPVGANVQFQMDSSGFLFGDSTNNSPKFSLTPAMTADLANGIQGWNGQSNGTNVTFTYGNSTTFEWIISAGWPKATVTYTDTAGHSHTWPVDASSYPSSTVAVTFYLPDYNGGGTTNGAAAAAVTLINTSGSYTVNGTTYPIFDPNGPNFDNALTALGTHESGHGFGLGDQNQCGDIMSAWGPASSANPSGGTNNQGGCATKVITICDNQEVLNNPNGMYNPPPPPPPPPDNCFTYGCTCNGTCEKDGTCTYTIDCSPILIAVGQSADIQLTSAQNGVWFDLEATGKREWVAWTQAGEPVAFLVRDVNHNGRIDNGSELFGNHTLLPDGRVAPNGFYALAAYDRPENGGNGDGVIDSRDAIWSDLQLWIDWNHNGVSESNELYRLNDFGLTQISLAYETTNRSDQFGNVFRLKAPCELAGKVRFGYDVYFSARPSKQ
jgi:hypothetical protein